MKPGPRPVDTKRQKRREGWNKLTAEEKAEALQSIKKQKEERETRQRKTKRRAKGGLVKKK